MAKYMIADDVTTLRNTGFGQPQALLSRVDIQLAFGNDI